MGRPQKEIDQTQFEKLCGLQCTLEEICGWFDVTDKTLDGWCMRTYREHFSEVFSKKREAGKISLRRSQWRLAEKSAAMAIFLGKNYLGQSDHVVIEDRSALDKLDEILKGTQENAIELQRKAE
jgi:hypothetical protein